MRKSLFITSFLMACIGIQSLKAQEINNKPKKGKVYLSTNLDMYLLTTSKMSNGRVENKWTTPRFTGFFHYGLNANYDFNANVGVMGGISIKNLGFIEKYNNPDSTAIRRAYTFGIPLALKLGNLEGNKTYFLIGGGVDFPFHYKEKGFIKRNDKTKSSEWFSDKTNQVLPYFFVGARFNPGVYFKLQYYPTNFLNTEYSQTITVNNVTQTVKPYANYDVNTLMISLGFDIKYTPKY
jgi:hypothetical protein